MPVNYISEVTKSVINLIKLEWERLEESDLVLSPLPLEKLGEGEMSFFLYHVQEDAHHKNMPPPGKDDPPVRYTPMPLNLFYQLGVKFDAESDDDQAFYEGQKKMSVAMKALHDYPEITDKTKIQNSSGDASLPVFVDSIMGKQNRFRIMLQPKPETDAVHYWTAGTSPLTWAAYYEVSVVYLNPEKSKTYAGRVLQYGAFVFPEGVPRITRSQNILEFDLPNSGSQNIAIQPAQAPYGDIIDFLGSGFSGGTIALLLSHGRWKNPVLADSWNPELVKEGQVRVTVQDKAINQDNDSEVAVLPGLYGAQLIITRSRTLPNGEIREFSYTSNQFPITVSPQITSVSTAGGVITVTGNIFKHAELKDGDVQVYLGETRLSEGSDNTPGFSISSPQEIVIRMPAPLPDDWESGQCIPWRILVNGAESPPHWYVVP